MPRSRPDAALTSAERRPPLPSGTERRRATRPHAVINSSGQPCRPEEGGPVSPGGLRPARRVPRPPPAARPADRAAERPSAQILRYSSFIVHRSSFEFPAVGGGPVPVALLLVIAGQGGVGGLK